MPKAGTLSQSGGGRRFLCQQLRHYFEKFPVRQAKIVPVGAPRERRRRIFSSIPAGIVMLFALFGFESICGYYLRNVSQHLVLFCKLFFPSRELPVSIPVEVNVKIAKTTAVTVRLDPELKGPIESPP
jgi:hypothetical protein